MRIRHRTSFSTIKTEGAILPPDLLEGIHEGDGDLGGLKASDYHLQPGERLNEVISRSWNRMLGAWRNFRKDLVRLPEDDPGTTVTRERLLLLLFQELGFGRLQTSRALEIDGKSYPVSHSWNDVPIHLVGARVELDRRTPGVAGAARSSPHSIVQELLNRSDEHLWAFLSNGYQLRILRDNISLVRQAYVEFDLHDLFEGEAYADFSMLWMLCHQSRVEADVPEEFWLERWSQQAQEQGARALDQLRDGVEAAIRHLGQGFLLHPANHALQEDLRSGALTGEEYYRQLLRLVYRLIFLFAAEERDLLHPPNADPSGRERYQSYYSTNRLRRLAGRLRGTRHADLFQSLKMVMGKLNQEGGCPELGLPGLGSFLWSEEAMPDLLDSRISNHALLVAVHSLAYTTDGGVRRAVDYKNMGAEELGSVYEALLELHPEMNTDAGTFELKVVGGSERKTTGSYYTPSSLIQQLLNTALDPVVEQALQDEDTEKALLDLKVCDPACGSGHFLIAAAHRIAKHLATVQTGDPEPSPEATRGALRQVIGRCIYGVDVNPMAVELCKVNLWLEALEPGKPLSFLDHRIQCGNSLLGATPALIEGGIPDDAFREIEGDNKEFCKALRKQNKAERAGQMSMFEKWAAEERATYQTLSVGMEGLVVLEEDTLAAQREKQERYERLISSDEYLRAKLVADAWCAAFFWPKRKDAPPPVTQAVFRKLTTEPENVAAETLQKIDKLADHYRLFHWHLALPEAFHVDELDSALPEVWPGGFDVVLGNPPWERYKLQDKEWFAGRNDNIAKAPNKSARGRLIRKLRLDDPKLWQRYSDARRVSEASRQFTRNSGSFPLCGRGDINTYQLFAELGRSLQGPGGRAGMILPSGIVTSDTTKFFFQDLVENGQVVAILDFENRRRLFPAVQRNVRFCLFTISKSSIQEILFAAQLTSTEQLRQPGATYRLSSEDIRRINPNTLTCPMFSSKADAEVIKKIYRNVPCLLDETTEDGDPWGVSFQTLFHMANDSEMFRTFEQLSNDGWMLDGYCFIGKNPKYLPLYESKFTHQYNHRAATFEGISSEDLFGTHPATNEVTSEQLRNPEYSIKPRYWVSEAELQGGIEETGWLMGFRDAISATADARSLIATVLPPVPVGHTESLVHVEPRGPEAACLLAMMNSFPMDYVLKQKATGGHASYYIMKQLPTPPPEAFAQACPWFSELTMAEWVSLRVLELSYTSYNIAKFAESLSYSGAPFVWDEERRFLLRRELDAAAFHIFGLDKPEVEHILNNFSIVKSRDLEESSEYRTKRITVEIFDEISRAIQTGESYKTRLNPPPADPRVAHEVEPLRR